MNENKMISFSDVSSFEPSNNFIEDTLYKNILENVPIVCVDGVLRRGDKIFLIKRLNEPAKDVWWFQGGRLNKHELPEEGVLRLVSKELNVDKAKLSVVQNLGTFSSSFKNSAHGCSTHTINITFEIQLENGTEPNFDKNHSEGKWFSIDGTGSEFHQHHPYVYNIFKIFRKNVRVVVTGAGGFIASHLGKRLKNEGFYVIGADIKINEFMENNEFCNEFVLTDLRSLTNCVSLTKKANWVFNLAADMGGMGFISTNNAQIIYNNTMISLNVLESCRINEVRRLFYSSSACVYPEYRQLDPNNSSLKESDAWPAQCQDGYGFEKLYAEEAILAYGKEFQTLIVRIARFHNIYGPHGTWKGGREKVPAAFCRKAATCEKTFEIWGDGEQTRTFCFIDDCVEGCMRLMWSDYDQPLNIGSDELISVNELSEMVLDIAGKNHIEKVHLKGPEGVRGRSSDNTLIKKILKWSPSISLRQGMEITFEWIKKQIENSDNSRDLQSSILLRNEFDTKTLIK